MLGCSAWSQSLPKCGPRTPSRTVAVLLLSLLLPACGSGVNGVAPPPLLDMTHIVRPSSPNTALAAPEGFTPRPDIVTPSIGKPAAALFAAIVSVALAQPRTFLLARYDGQLQAHFVARIPVLGFPDLIAVQVLADGAERSKLVIWSRSVYGWSDFGVNRRRVTAWLAALERSPS